MAAKTDSHLVIVEVLSSMDAAVHAFFLLTHKKKALRKDVALHNSIIAVINVIF